MLRSLTALINFAVSYAIQAYSATATTTAVDLAGYRGAALLIVTGAFSFSETNKITVTLEESNDNSTFNVVAAADIVSPESGTVAKVLDGTEDQNTVHTIHYKGAKRYVRAVMTEAGTVAVSLGVLVCRGLPQAAPPA